MKEKVIKEYNYTLRRKIIAVILLIICLSIGGFAIYEKETVNNTYYISVFYSTYYTNK